jgi:hypothetical protein
MAQHRSTRTGVTGVARKEKQVQLRVQLFNKNRCKLAQHMQHKTGETGVTRKEKQV